MPAPLFVVAPGAGAPSTSPWMLRFIAHFSRLGPVVAFDYPYQQLGRRAPDRLPVLIDAHREAVEGARTKHPERALVLVGKSMGSRVGCHVSLTTPVSALVNFGYPLISAGRAAKLRDQVLRELTTPALFVQGSRDPMAPLDRLAPLLEQLAAPTELHVVEDGDHSLESTRSSLARRATTQEQVEDRIMAAVTAFLEKTLGQPCSRP